jgi:hypothetical protein
LKKAASPVLDPDSSDSEESGVNSEEEDAKGLLESVSGSLFAKRKSLELASRIALVLLLVLWGTAFAPTAVKYTYASLTNGASKGIARTTVSFGLDVSRPLSARALALASPTPFP